MTLYDPDCKNVGVQSKLPVPSPFTVKVAPEGRADTLKTGVLSMSVAETAKESVIFSTVERAPIAVSIGSWLPPSLTVMVTISESTAVLSSVA